MRLRFNFRLCPAFLLLGTGLPWLPGCKPRPASETVTPAGVACLGHLIPGEGVIALGAPHVEGGGPPVVVERRVRRGERVEAGQILVVLSNHPVALAGVAEARAEAGLAEAELARVEAGAKPASIEAARAVVAQREAELENERPAFARARTLFEKTGISTAELETAQRRFLIAERALAEARYQAAALEDVREVDVAAAEKRLELARARLAGAEARLELTVIRAPRAGQVLDTLLQAGESAAGPVLMFGETGAMGVEAYVYDSDLARVRVGATATVSGPAFAGELRGTVSDVAPVLLSAPAAPFRPEEAADRRVAKARIALVADDAARVAGLSHQEVQVRIEP